MTTKRKRKFAEVNYEVDKWDDQNGPGEHFDVGEWTNVLPRCRKILGVHFNSCDDGKTWQYAMTLQMKLDDRPSDEEPGETYQISFDQFALEELTAVMARVGRHMAKCQRHDGTHAWGPAAIALFDTVVETIDKLYGPEDEADDFDVGVEQQKQDMAMLGADDEGEKGKLN